jgi:(E)-4-hydroxy-3-methylbut-2-enyl-diphosphate synthase
MTKEIKIGDVTIGGTNPVAIQSMTTTPARDVKATIDQAKRLISAGCDIVRVTVPDMDSAKAIKEIKKEIKINFVADIHFDYKLAIESIKNGADKIRLNPGNIGEDWKVIEVIKAAKDYGVPIRVGSNSGSLKKDYLLKYGKVTVEGLVQSALDEVRLMEKNGFYDIVVSVKSSNVKDVILANEKLSSTINYPLHLGVTEAGPYKTSVIKSSIAMGYLLLEGIGDTIRVSITGDPVDEVYVAEDILKSVGLKKGLDIVSCPTCGRTEVDLIELVEKMSEALKPYKNKNLKIAMMGCVVNGPGEAREADIGIAGGKNVFVVFKKGKIIGKMSENEAFDFVLNFVKEYKDEV